MSEENVSKEMEVMEMEHRIGQFRHDLPGDVLASAKLLKAAFENNWSEVERLLASGTDPRICRRGDAYGVESALFYALQDLNFEMAVKLYDAGDRLDDLVIEEEEKLSPDVLAFLIQEMRYGRNLFFDESKPLSECCRCANFARIKELIESADREELSRSIKPTVRAWFRYYRRTDSFVAVLTDLIRLGATISEEEKADILSEITTRFGRCPDVLHAGKAEVETVTDLIRNMQVKEKIN